jgi:hypothetical protein
VNFHVVSWIAFRHRTSSESPGLNPAVTFYLPLPVPLFPYFLKGPLVLLDVVSMHHRTLVRTIASFKQNVLAVLASQ